ncbi:MAG: amidase, partial [Rhizobiales bacterium]|nr:amidase [Hyphomicrobiales bacterium]
PYGRNPEEPPFNLDFYCHVGPLARTVADTILLQNVMCGPHPKDIASLRPKLKLPSNYKSIDGWKIAYSPNLGFYEVDEGVQRNTEAALEVFRACGATVEEVELGWTQDCLTAALTYLEHLFGASIAPTLDKHSDKLTDYARQFAEKGRSSTSADYLWSLEVAGKMYNSLGPVLEAYDVLVCPTTALPAVAADFDQSRDTVEINGKQVNPMLGWVMTSPFNIMSRCPVLTLPSGRASNAIPTGIQIVGKTYQDADVFRAATAYEAAAGAWFTNQNNRPKLNKAQPD